MIKVSMHRRLSAAKARGMGLLWAQPAMASLPALPDPTLSEAPDAAASAGEAVAEAAYVGWGLAEADELERIAWATADVTGASAVAPDSSSVHLLRRSVISSA